MLRARPFRGFAPDELERQYQPSSRVQSLQRYLDEYAERGRAGIATTPARRIAYGPHADEWLWYVPAAGGRTDVAVHAFVHGGYWQALSADDGMGLAPGFHAAGVAFASVNYTLCPGAPLAELVRQVRSAVRFLASAGDPGLAHDPARVHLSGHSAGAHLVAMAAADPSCPMAGATFVSGVYDLAPLVHTTVNEALGLDEPGAKELSPLGHVPKRPGLPTIVTWGEDDTDEFRRQSLAWAAAWAEVEGNRPPVALEVGGRNHFDVIDDLPDPATPVGRAVVAQMRR